ncbi:hypothetical protein IC582_016202 [Cucumis melo]
MILFVVILCRRVERCADILGVMIVFAVVLYGSFYMEVYAGILGIIVCIAGELGIIVCIACELGIIVCIAGILGIIVCIE